MTQLWDSHAQVWLYSQPTDMRKAVNGLTQIVAHDFKMKPQSGDIFVFVNRSKDKAKFIFWHYNGFFLGYKRLDKDHFKLPKDSNQSLKLNEKQLYRLLEGLHFVNEKEGKELIFY